MKKLNNKIDFIFEKKLFSLKNKTEIFFKFMLNLTRFHFSNCKSYKKILDGFNINLKNIKNLNDLPYLPIRIFKDNELLSVKQKNIIKVLRSSGTTGSKTSKIFLDKTNSQHQIKTLNKIVKNSLGDERLPMLIIDKKANHKNIKQMNARIAAINGFSIFGKNHTYLLDENEKVNFKEFESFVKKYNKKKFLIFGFTSLIFENLIQIIGEKKEKFDLSKGIILHGGGWKKLEKLKISNKKFKSILFNNFRIKQIINYYGLVEQTGSIYLECVDCSRFITSEFSNIIIRDDNLYPCKRNKTGMIQTMSLLPSSYPGHNILTEDIGEIKGEDDCHCGKKGKYFLVHGRIEKAEVRGCSNVT